MTSLQNGRQPKLWERFSPELAGTITQLMNRPGTVASFVIRPEVDPVMAGIIGTDVVEITLRPWRIVVSPTERGAKARLLFHMEEDDEQLSQLRQATDDLSTSVAWLAPKPDLDVAAIGANMCLDENGCCQGEIFVEVTGEPSACSYAKDAIDMIERALIGRVNTASDDEVAFLSKAFAQVEVVGDELFRALLDAETTTEKTAGSREGAF